ncbi:hypothetical protein NQ318_015844 [Aromia moschata]|uniref:Uncharacterized protein n=1 Tax=Aromia moschata TaxID=1265417 RepID=A0AAV8YRJ2_9CUCU|nr:hypothetical protein NQ318_015844 [Aromia moschata]
MLCQDIFMCSTLDRSLKHRRKDPEKRWSMCSKFANNYGHSCRVLVQNTLKYLLEFGQVTNYLGYNALTDFFPTMNLKPNPNCEDSNCQEFALKPKPEIAVEAKEEEKPLHEDNEWGISLVDESIDEVEPKVVEGVKLAYTLPNETSIEECQEATTNDISLEELMAQMKSI